MINIIIFIIKKIVCDLNISNSTKQRKRKYQHIFIKKLLVIDKRYLICYEEYPYLLYVAYIKPDSYCYEDSINRYDENNGITLCKNHHRLSDKNNFTFHSD